MIRETFTFEAEAEARAFADKFNRDFWAYSGIASTYQTNGIWKVETVRWPSCD